MFAVGDNAVTHLEAADIRAYRCDHAGIAIAQRERLIEFVGDCRQRCREPIGSDLLQCVAHAIGLLHCLAEQARAAEVD
ncbi:hypothetical protein [Paraburkholderia piptadeniae]|uniref:hypothetical protein n=1 Tax=Paraburkholderia piptadeniae TaxID=1701573 RepID=UPI001F442BAA|nr:hypothetical protein [Paraburkholderia piptadeniae]